MKRITTVVVGESKYEIVQNRQGFWAINHEFIGKNGRPNREINGINGLLSKTANNAIRIAMLSGHTNEFKRNNPNHTDEELRDFMLKMYEDLYK